MSAFSSEAVRGKRADIGGWLLFVLLTSVGLMMVSPLVYMVSTALKPPSELFLFPPRFFVMNPTGENFYQLLLVTNSSIVPFSRYLFNSGFVTVCVVVGSIALSVMAAYPLSKHDMPLKRMIFSMIILALMFSPQVTQVPQYLVIHSLGFMDTYWALILPALASPLGLFLVKQFLDQIPEPLLEAARIDGAGEWTILRSIVYPMLKPATHTVALFTFLASWNDPNASTLFIQSEQMRTLPYMLQTINAGAGVVARAGAVSAAAMLMVVPVVIVFVLTQRRVLETMATSGLKE